MRVSGGRQQHKCMCLVGGERVGPEKIRILYTQSLVHNPLPPETPQHTQRIFQATPYPPPPPPPEKCSPLQVKISTSLFYQKSSTFYFFLLEILVERWTIVKQKTSKPRNYTCMYLKKWTKPSLYMNKIKVIKKR